MHKLIKCFSDLPTVTNIRNVSRICPTHFNISWDAPSITCGDVYYEVSISPPPIEGDAIRNTTVTSFSVTGLNNSLPDVTITVTAIDRVGQRNGSMLSVQLPRSPGKCCTVPLKDNIALARITFSSNQIQSIV